MLEKTKAGFYVLPKLAQVPGLIHGFSTTDFGNMSYTHGSKNKVLSNQTRFSQAVGVDPETLFAINQKHGKRIVTIREDTLFDQSEKIEADAMITNQRKMAFLIKTADCLPLILVHPLKKVIGLIHAGRPGVQLGIHREVLIRIKAVFAVNPAELLVGFGPAICARCYHAKIDLVNIVQNDLVKMGVKKENIEPAGICTFENPDFYSHQKSVITGKPEKRFATLLAWI